MVVRFFSHLFTFFIFILFLVGSGLLFVFYKYGRGLPSYKQLRNYEPPQVTRLYASDGRLFAEYATEKRMFVPIENIPKRIVKTFLAAEDKNFYDHFGIDVLAIFRSAGRNISRMMANQRPMGASTITQQVARNFFLQDQARLVSFERKIKEAILTLRIESAYTKDHILELYLNEIYLGRGCYGVAAAALYYFNKSLDQLTISEAAFLGGLPKAPSHYDPERHNEKAIARRNWVIHRMIEENLISSEKGREALKEPLTIRRRDPADSVYAEYFAEEVRRDILKTYGPKTLYEAGLVVRTSLDPQLQSFADGCLRDGLVGYDQRKSGWRGAVTKVNLDLEKAHTTPLKKTWQSALNQVKKPLGMRQNWELAIVLHTSHNVANIGLMNGKKAIIPLEEITWARKAIDFKTRGPRIKKITDVLTRGDVVIVQKLDQKKTPERYTLRQIPKVQGGLIAMDPHTGKILAMSGGFSFARSQFNRVTQALRQPGSVFKPFVYLTGLEEGYSPSKIIVDAPLAIDLGPEQGVWKPQNYEKRFFGPTTLRRGLEKSRNIVALRLVIEKLGIKKVANLVQRLGLYEDLPQQYATVLGTEEITLMRLATGYAMIANGGKEVRPTLIQRIQDRKGKTLFSAQAPYKICANGCQQGDCDDLDLPTFQDKRQQLINPHTAYQLTSILQGGIKRGTGRVVKKFIDVDTHPIAGKTGTTNDFRDAWYIGYTPDLVVGVLVGFDGPRSLGEHESGARIAAPIFAKFMAKAAKMQAPVPFRVPPGMRMARINLETGLKAQPGDKNVIFEAFRPENDIPTELSSQEKQEDTPSSDSDNPLNTGGIY